MSVFSDDTDILLLIPPDFFTIKNEDSDDDAIDLNKPVQRLLVSDLISQVNDLEGRICMIENQSITKMSLKGELQRLGHYGSVDSLNTSPKFEHNPRSLQTTPVKNNTLVSPFKNWKTARKRCLSKCNTEINSHPKLLTSNQYLNQKERDDVLLKEIHNFFKHKNLNNNVGSRDKYKTQEDSESTIFETAVKENKHLSAAVFNLNKVNNLLRQLEETQAEIEQKLKVKSINISNYEESFDMNIYEKKLIGPNITSDTLAKGNSKTFEGSLDSDLNEEKNGHSSKKEEIPLTLSVSNDRVSLDLIEKTPKADEIVNVELQPESQASSTEFNDILSLSRLWSSDKKIDDFKSEEQKIIKQKLEEEKCRREHCEELIKKLHVRLLEDQQKIAVAIKVDQEKDEAISKLSEAWNKLVGHLKDLEIQKSDLEKQLVVEQKKFQNEVSTIRQTVQRYEVELSKALDLAHGYKEKCELSEKEKENLIEKTCGDIENLKKELAIKNEKLETECEQKLRWEKIVASKEESLIQMRSKVFDMQNQVKDLRKNVKDHQTETEALKHEKVKLSEKLREERNRVMVLEQTKKSLLQNNEDLKKKEKLLKENIKVMADQIEKIKVDLKKFYQEQVEKIVQEKLKEFQGQLASAEKTLQKEIEERERKITEMAVKQVQQIVEKHVLEINLLEEKHNQEIELWRLKVLQAEETVQNLQLRLKEYSSQKTEIAQKLQNVMETQWQEALKIITASSPHHQNSALDSEKSDSPNKLNRQNTFTMLSCGYEEESQKKNCFPSESISPSPSDSTLTEIPFGKDGQQTFRDQKKNSGETEYRIDETPQKIEAATTDSLKKYIQMLLERPPGIPVDDSTDKSFESIFNALGNTSDLMHWQHILAEQSRSPIEQLKKL